MEQINKRSGWTILIVIFISVFITIVFLYYFPGIILPATPCVSYDDIPTNKNMKFFNISYQVINPKFYNMKLFDTMIYTSDSTSMFPVISQGDILLHVFDFTEEDIQLGSIIGFPNNNILMPDYISIVHRVVKIEEKNGEKIYTTKGDNSPIEDSETIKYEDIQFVVAAIYLQ